MLRSLARVGVGAVGIAATASWTAAEGTAPSPAAAARLFSLEGRKALVTGGSKGLGEAVAHGLVSAGCDVIITARNEAQLKEAQVRIEAAGTGRCEYIVCDLADRAKAEALGPEVLRRFGGQCDSALPQHATQPYPQIGLRHRLLSATPHPTHP